MENVSEKSEQFGLKPHILASIIEFAKIHNIDRLTLFGSRARGDFKERSDIDLAAKGGNIRDFRFDLDEKAPTLLSFDVVNLDDTNNEKLLENIEREGKVIYAKV